MAASTDRLAELRIERDEGTAERPRLWLWIALALGVLGVVFGGVWWAVAGRAPKVGTATVREVAGSSAGAVLNASGYVTARRRATVSSKVTGKLVEVTVEEGMPVREGQVLARLDDTLPRSYLAVAEAELAAVRGAVAETETKLRLARLTLERTRSLAASGVVGQAALDQAQADLDSLEARLAVDREQVAVWEKNVAARRAELDDTVIRAPFSGIAISKDAQPGEMVSPAAAGGGFTRTGVSTIVDMGSLEIEVDVNESYIHRVRPGQRVEAVLDAYPDWRIPSSVITIVPAADRQKATVLVRIAFDRLDPRILPDMGVKVSFLAEAEAGAERKARLVVPKAAVRKDGGEDVVLVVREGRVERRAVRVGASQGDEVDVLAGLTAGETVVVEAPPGLGDGARVVPR